MRTGILIFLIGDVCSCLMCLVLITLCSLVGYQACMGMRDKPTKGHSGLSVMSARLLHPCQPWRSRTTHA